MAGKLSIKIKGVKALRNALKATATQMADAQRQALNAAGALLLDEVRKNVSLRDHSLDALAGLDHPYARRHGRIQESKLGHPGWKVHTQTGRLLNATRGRQAPGGEYEVYFDLGRAPHARYVVLGTKVMMPRDPIMQTANQKHVRHEMMRSIVRVLGKVLRTGANVRFGA